MTNIENFIIEFIREYPKTSIATPVLLFVVIWTAIEFYNASEISEDK